MSKTEKRRLLWVAVIVENERGQLLLARRTNPSGIDEGMYGPPGGHVQQGEALWLAAMRECKEETGCTLFDPHEIGYYDGDPRGVVHFVKGTLRTEPTSADPDHMGPWGWVAPMDDDSSIQSGARAYWRGDYTRVVRLEKPV